MWAFAAAIFIVCMVALSRVYLGVHYPADILAGVGIGLATVVVWYALWARSPWPLEQRSLLLQIALPASILGAYLALIPSTTAQGNLPGGAVLAACAVLGFWIGLCLDRRFWGHVPPQTWRKRLVAAVVGLAILAALRHGIDWAHAASLAPAQLVAPLGYAAIGIWISLGGPWLFRRLGLTTSQGSVARAEP
jgi:hypothetical protein